MHNQSIRHTSLNLEQQHVFCQSNLFRQHAFHKSGDKYDRVDFEKSCLYANELENIINKNVKDD